MYFYMKNKSLLDNHLEIDTFLIIILYHFKIIKQVDTLIEGKIIHNTFKKLIWI